MPGPEHLILIRDPQLQGPAASALGSLSWQVPSITQLYYQTVETAQGQRTG